MPYELFIALRYLRARRRQAAVSVITAIAVAGITLGVTALIIAQALITGFRADVQDKVLQGTAHLNLLKVDNGGIENYRELVERVRAEPGVSAASATIYAQVLLSAHGRGEGSRGSPCRAGGARAGAGGLRCVGAAGRMSPVPSP